MNTPIWCYLREKKSAIFVHQSGRYNPEEVIDFRKNAACHEFLFAYHAAFLFAYHAAFLFAYHVFQRTSFGNIRYQFSLCEN
jgi:hypothetical protein